MPAPIAFHRLEAMTRLVFLIGIAIMGDWKSPHWNFFTSLGAPSRFRLADMQFDPLGLAIVLIVAFTQPSSLNPPLPLHHQLPPFSLHHPPSSFIFEHPSALCTISFHPRLPTSNIQHPTSNNHQHV
jgi:hypothetical protein